MDMNKILDFTLKTGNMLKKAASAFEIVSNTVTALNNLKNEKAW